MIFLKANIAEGSFLGRGTHIWLEIRNEKAGKTTFSGAKSGRLLHVYRDYKRDYDRAYKRGLLEVPPPEGISDEEWDKTVIKAALEVQQEFHGHFAFNGLFPWGTTREGLPRSNCCHVVSEIISRAGGTMPKGKLRGVLPKLGRGISDYL